MFVCSFESSHDFPGPGGCRRGQDLLACLNHRMNFADQVGAGHWIYKSTRWLMWQYVRPGSLHPTPTPKYTCSQIPLCFSPARPGPTPKTSHSNPSHSLRPPPLGPQPINTGFSWSDDDRDRCYDEACGCPLFLIYVF